MRLIFLFLLIGLVAHAVPSPMQVIVDNATKECSFFSTGDECTRCEMPEGWTSLGIGSACPSGFREVEAQVVCKPLTSQFCCSQGHSGSTGNCTGLMVNDGKKQCAFATAGSGWTNASICPADYEWSGGDGSVCPLGALLLLSIMVWRR